MILLSTILARATAAFAGHGLVIGLVAALGIMVLTWDRGRINSAVQRGKEQVRVETQKANDAAVQTSDRVRARAQSGSVRNAKRDPYTID